ncbi:MAG: trypsin-like peptidase domain-containing protein [Ectothiorhodospiraceae bacterium]|nr:trypsin-like peptidase domain-containing protein [Ectothiorhodospiraceae bacterium]
MNIIMNTRLLANRVLLPMLLMGAMLIFSSALSAGNLPATISVVKKSIVGIGTHQLTRVPRGQLIGTGFVVADGLHVITNYHVVSKPLNTDRNESLVVFNGRGSKPEIRSAKIVASDPVHDLALLKITGKALPVMRLGDSGKVQEGEGYVFTGFPIGAVLGLYPVTHGGMISARTPIVVPMGNSGQLTPALIKSLRSPFEVFQLDATAYPGNSGSPLYHPDNGEVLGIINMVFVKETRETVLEKPSGIAFAIPSRYAAALIERVMVGRGLKGREMAEK